jgi:hypothetical protein
LARGNPNLFASGTKAMSILSLRILPPMAIARLGSARECLDNYRLVPDPDKPLELPKLTRDRTLIIDTQTGAIVGEKPASDETPSFKLDGKIRPLAPFLEVFAELTGQTELVPLGRALIEQLQLTARWHVRLGNDKLYRRTNDPNDRILADTGWFSDHRQHLLAGKCNNFVQANETTLPMGSVQFLQDDARYPQFRLRFMPGNGEVFGATPLTDEQKARLNIPAIDPNSNWYPPAERQVYDSQKGSWHGYRDQDQTINTLSQGLYSAYGRVPFFNYTETPEPSRGFLDNAGDGEVIFELIDASGFTKFSAHARICAAPPIFAPDAQFVRRLSDDLIQVIKGPTHNEADKVRLDQAEEIVRGAFQTLQFMNIAVLNGDTVRGRPNRADTMGADDASDFNRPLASIMAPHAVDTWAILDLHRQLYVALKSGVPAWFDRLMRSPDETADLSDHGRRKMPALMSGADTNYLALTHRQLDTLKKAGKGALFDEPEAERETGLTPRNRTAQLLYKGEFNPPSAIVSSSVGNCCPGLELDFRSAWRRVLKGITLVEHNNFVVQADPEYAHLLQHRLLRIDGKETVGIPKVPTADNSSVNSGSPFTKEWSNTLAGIWQKAGQLVVCEFTKSPAPDEVPVKGSETITVEMQVRPFFAPESATIAPEMAEPGELTRGLCSPWQNDFRECVCYYWASSRPDYVNLEPSENGSKGDNWMSKTRDGQYVMDDYNDSRLINYADLFSSWERILSFQIGGRDAE